MTVELAAAATLPVVLAALAARALTPRGALAATGVGLAILWAAGWAGGAVLLAFFVTGSAVGRLVGRPVATDAKGERRDAAQVIANGGAAALAAVLARHDPALAAWLVTGALAAAGADTAATAWGSGSRTPPRHLLTWQVVPAGTSGGITLRGTAGAALGALFVALAGAAALRTPAVLAAAVALGILGMLADSVLGAACQGRFHCDRCDLPSEWPVHRCGAPTRLEGGMAWINNDAVNLLATGLTAVAAWAIAPRVLR